jgi:uncharacterized repeat protein (TIGR01451 family)
MRIRNISYKNFRRIIATVLVWSFFQAPLGAFWLNAKTAHAQEATDTTAPTVSMQSPLGGTTISGEVEVAATAGDDVGVASVQFVLNGSDIGALDSEAPFQIMWTTTSVSNGAHELKAVAKDAAGNATTSEAVTVQVNNPDITAPVVSITSPLEGATVNEHVNIVAGATDNIGIKQVQLYRNGTAFGKVLTDAPYKHGWNTLVVSNGDYVWTAVATDEAGNSTTSQPVTIHVENAPDTVNPTITFQTPKRGDTLKGEVTVKADVDDDRAIAGVQFRRNNEAWGAEDITAPYELPWNTLNDLDGCYLVEAVARDIAGNTTHTEIVPVIVLNPEPDEAGCTEGQEGCTTEAEVTNNTSANVTTCVNSAAGTGGNTSNNNDTPSATAINTGDATSGVGIPNQVNTTITEVAPGQTGHVDIEIENNTQADLKNYVTADATTGDNSAQNNRFGEINTGDANVFATIVNAVNTTLTGSNFDFAVENIVNSFVGDINFVDLLIQFFNGLFAASGSATLNVSNTSQGTLTNDIEINASTGSNTANLNRAALINTGDIYVGSNILNLLNTNVIGANWFFSTMNVFGDFTGDIILPGEGVMDNLFANQLHNLSITNNDLAEINNSVVIDANTGANDASGNRDGATVTTGNVTSQTSVWNQINTNLIGMNFFNFNPHIFGNWQGSVINGEWGNYFEPIEGNSDMNIHVSNTNDAVITNNLRINADTGHNRAFGNRAADIATGDINVATSLYNLANTNIVGSNWFMGNFNLFGNWKGNIVYAYPDLAVASHCQPSANAGEQVTYTLYYQNGGLAPAKNIQISDVLPPYTTFVSASDGGVLQGNQVIWNLPGLAKKSDMQAVTFTVQVDSSMPIGETVLANTVSIATTTREPQTANNTGGSQFSVQVAPPPAPATPEVAAVAQSQPQLSIQAGNTTTGPIAPGSSVTYKIALTNTGNVTIENVTIQDRLPDSKGKMLIEKSFGLPSLPAGQTMHAEYSVTIPKDTPAAVYRNTTTGQANFQGQLVGPVSTSNQIEVKTAAQLAKKPAVKGVATKAAPSALVIQQSHTPKKIVRQGEKISFIVTVYNKGKELLKSVILKGQLVNGKKHSPVQWKLGNIPVGKGVRLTFQLNLAANAQAGAYVNSLTATAKNAKGKAVASDVSKASFTVATALKGKKIAQPASKTSSVVSYNIKGGLVFMNQDGRTVSPWQFAQQDMGRLVEYLSQSKDPSDRQLVRTYTSGLTLVGKRGKNGVVITRKMITDDLQRNPLFRHIFGGSQLSRS